MKAIAIVGKMGSGKSTVAGILKSKGFVHHSWAEPVRAIFSMAYDQITPENYADIKAKTYDVVERGLHDVPGPTQRTGRELLQRIGTDAMRERVDLDFWVKAGMNKAAELIAQGSCVVNDDTRFLNEADALRGLGFDIVRIVRPGHELTGNHPSEVEQESIAADFTIVNDGDLLALYRKVDDLVFGTAAKVITSEPWGAGDGPVYGMRRDFWEQYGVLGDKWPIHAVTVEPWGSTVDCNPGCKEAHPFVVLRAESGGRG